ncbi:uncharacterized protein PHALS_15265 [Plasmopara halstedii]|uniref:Uncharacterized protein n=1 Tax=Plasmopara halstedii TaxID=4781 RepID=A0A0P1B621_PLAHL|nr:uncharacterized protein PHALS_15265 [Plasmopara halstedii]CEG50255.1 hypothetical protein PHALS_15265 [Plasmopara halstedii]|eukprot:XP_024586624.1 hypothetical protein PHALS_15265 [Plasmopara halstedii]
MQNYLLARLNQQQIITKFGMRRSAICSHTTTIRISFAHLRESYKEKYGDVTGSLIRKLIEISKLRQLLTSIRLICDYNLLSDPIGVVEINQ